MKTLSKNALYFLLGSVFLFASCKKKADDPVPTPIYPVATASGTSYMPTNSTRSWTYQSASYSYTTKPTGNTLDVNGRTYTELQSLVTGNPTPSLGYSLELGNQYYSYATFEKSTGGTGELELKMIDLDLPIGSTWSTVVETNLYTLATYRFKYTGKGLTRTVNNVTYNDVISVDLHTTATLQNIPSGIPASYFQSFTAAYKFDQTAYYAKGIGLIEQTSPTPSLQVVLVKYTK